MRHRIRTEAQACSALAALASRHPRPLTSRERIERETKQRARILARIYFVAVPLGMAILFVAASH
jgi:hypothetical protein